MTKNLPLLKATLTQILRHPETHNQDFFGLRVPGCGTAHCAAGWAVHLTDGPDVFVWHKSLATRTRGREVAMMVTTIDGPVLVWQRAASLLGLNQDEAEQLFFGSTNEEAVAYLHELIRSAEETEPSSTQPERENAHV